MNAWKGTQNPVRWAWRWFYWNVAVRQLGYKPTPRGQAKKAVLSESERVSPPLTENVRTWVETHNHAWIQILYPASCFTRTLPITIEPDYHYRYLVDLTIPILEKYITPIAHARFVGKHGLIVLPDGSFALEHHFNNAGHIDTKPEYYTPLPQRRVFKRGKFYSLIALYGLEGNYYHWMHDVLIARLYGVMGHLPGEIQYLVPPKLKQFQKDTLELFGIRPSQLVEFRGDEMWELERLYFAPHTMMPGWDAPDADAWFRQFVWAKYNITPKRERRLFISRAKAKHRRVVNEPEIADIVRDYGFEFVDNDQLSLREQVELYAQADVVAAGHGAGFGNLLFVPPGARVIDIFEPDYVNVCYWTLAGAVGQQYGYFFGETVRSTEWNHDIYIPRDKLVRMFETMGVERRR